MIEHKKVSGVANTVSEKVGGGDWDDKHVYPVGSVFVFAFAYLVINGASGFVSEASPWVSVDAVYVQGGDSKYRLVLTIDVTKLPIRAGTHWTPRVIFDYESDAYPSKMLSYSAHDWVTGQITFVVDNLAGSATGSFAALTRIKALISIEVTV